MGALGRDIAELDFRSNNGVNVLLLWHRATRRLTIFVYDEHTGGSFEFAVDATDARDAFQHPYAYYAHRNLAVSLG
jgi:hypothetical protein